MIGESDDLIPRAGRAARLAFQEFIVDGHRFRQHAIDPQS